MKTKHFVAIVIVMASFSLLNAQKKKVQKIVTQKEVIQQQPVIRPALQIQTGHNRKVIRVGYSQCGNYIVSQAQDQFMIVWDAKTGRIIKRFGGKSFRSVTSNNQLVCFTEATDEFEIWDFSTLQLKKKFKKNSPINDGSTSVSPDGKYLATGNRNYGLVYDLATEKIVAELDIRPLGFEDFNNINQVQFSPDGTLLTIATFWGNTHTYSTKDWSLVNKFIYNNSQMDANFSYSPDGRNMIVSYKWKRYNDVFSLKDFSKIATFTMPDYMDTKLGTAYSSFSRDGKFVRVSPEIGPLLIYETTNWSLVTTTNIMNSSAIAFSPDDEYFVSGEQTAVKVYTKNGQLLKTFEGNLAELQGLGYNNDLHLLCVSADNSTRLWNMRELKLEFLYGGTDGILSSKAKYLASFSNKLSGSSWGGYGYIADVAAKKTIFEYRTPSFCRTVAFSNDEKYFIYSGANKNLNIYNIAERTTETVAFSGFQYNNSNEFFVASPIKNELLVFGHLNEMALYNFDSRDISYRQNYVVPINSDKQFISDAIVSPNGDDVAFVYTSTGVQYATFHPQTATMQNKFYSINGHYNGVHYSSDGKKLAIPDNPFRVIDAQTGDSLRQFPAAHIGDVTGVLFANEDKNIYSCGKDGTIKYWDAENGKEIFTFIQSLNSDEYIFITPDGYYKTTRLGTSLVHYLQGNSVITFDQFDLKYNRPDIVLQRAGADPLLVTAYHQAYLKRIRKMGFTEEELKSDINLPTLELLTKNIPLTTDNKQLTIKIKASDRKIDLNRINLFVNDIPIFGQKGIDLKALKTKDIEKEISFELSNGANKVQVSVMNSAGIESYRENFSVAYTGPVAKPSLYLVSIGISDYMNKEYNLTYAAKDAQDIETLAKSYAGHYSEIKTILLTNQKATTVEIVNAKKILDQSKPDDVVIIFVASHGLLDNKLDYFIATYDCDFNNPSGKGLAYDKLESLLDGIPARNKLMLIDACHSGEVDKEEKVVLAANTDAMSSGVKSRGFKRIVSASAGKNAAAKSIGLKNSFELMNEVFTNIQKGTGAIVISSAGGMEYAFESSEWNNGVFTYSILEGIKSKNADSNKNGKIIVSELRDYVIKHVQDLTAGKQNPTSRIENMDNDFEVW